MLYFRTMTMLLLALTLMAPVGAADDAQKRATAALENAVKSDPNNAELWSHLGFAYRKEERLDKAKEAFEKASTLSPQNVEALFMLGLIYEKENRKADALRVWRQYLAAAKDPDKRSMAETHIQRLTQ
jgi:cytochrome c-type biogenesis protein CcmH/NrfG